MFRIYQLLAAGLLFIASISFAGDTTVFSRQTVQVDEIALDNEFSDALPAAKEQEFTRLIYAGMRKRRVKDRFAVVAGVVEGCSGGLMGNPPIYGSLGFNRSQQQSKSM